MIDLDKQDIVNLLAALNALQVSGKEAHQTVLRLMAKLEAALKPEEPKE
ncbi:MAG: hypothetical protein WC935_00205 [Thermoleophilia bacterium]